MNSFFQANPAEAFQQFSISHLIVIFLIVAVNCIVYIFRTKIKRNKNDRTVRILIATLLLALFAADQFWEAAVGIWSVQSSLPLHMCGLSIFLCSFMLLYKSYPLYEITYFWGLAGASQAILTPDLKYPFPHFMFFQFFLTHSLIITGCLWITFIDDFTPTLKSLAKTFAVTNVYLVLIAAFNYFTGSNYMYICRKPEHLSLLAYMGPWPWYVFTGEFIALILFFICYLPFALAGITAKLKSRIR